MEYKGIMLIQTFILKVINDERKTLTYHEIIDRIAKQNVPVITEAWKKSKLWIHTNLRRYGGQVSHLLIHLSSFTFVL